jgi:cytochrome c biogenesis protein CcdA/peroxiredoxin
MLLLIGAFIAGMLTVLAPCVLPLLPIIIGGSVSGNKRDTRRPFIIAGSLAVSLIAFTLLLKATTLLVNIPPNTINYVSGVLIIILGIFSLFPTLYEKIITRLGVQSQSLRLLGKGTQNKDSVLGPIITGAALGPVFSSCSPVYAYIIATILPGSFAEAMAYIVSYVLGLAIVLLAIGLAGQRFVHKIRWATNPTGWFQRIVAILFILVGLLVFTNSARAVQTWVSQNTPFNFDALSAKLIPASDVATNKNILNVETPYDAPKIEGIENWINSGALSNEDLKGKVTLIDFWTYSCINCIRTQPYLRGWYDTYKTSDFQIIGLHAPEFAFERVPENVQNAAKDAKLTYPIGLDNDFTTWNNFGVRYWPSAFLIDADGKVRRVHYGEGEYKETEQAIRALLREAGKSVPESMYIKDDAGVPVSEQQTPETYTGTKRSQNYAGQTRLYAGQTSLFIPEDNLGRDKWTLGGSWNVTSENITAGTDASLRFNVSTKEVYVVASSDFDAEMTILLNGKPISETDSAGLDVKGSKVLVKNARLYRLVQFSEFRQTQIIELQVPEGISINAFTFGS